MPAGWLCLFCSLNVTPAVSRLSSRSAGRRVAALHVGTSQLGLKGENADGVWGFIQWGAAVKCEIVPGQYALAQLWNISNKLNSLSLCNKSFYVYYLVL